MLEEFVIEIEPTVIVNAVCKSLNLDPANVKGRKRYPHLADARFVAMHLMRKHSDLSLKSIGQHMGRGHCTVLYGLKRYEELFFSCSIFRNKVDNVKALLKDKNYDC